MILFSVVLGSIQTTFHHEVTEEHTKINALFNINLQALHVLHGKKQMLFVLS